MTTLFIKVLTPELNIKIHYIHPNKILHNFVTPPHNFHIITQSKSGINVKLFFILMIKIWRKVVNQLPMSYKWILCNGDEFL